MVFTDIRLQNYRSYSDSSFEFGRGVTIVVGPNAAGKSNLVEAVLMVCNGTAYRGKAGLIKHRKDWARIDVHTDKNSLRSIKIIDNKDQEKKLNTTEFEIDKKIYKRLPITQKQPSVLFEPNNLFLLHGEPKMRREFLDNLATQTTPGFSNLFSRYKRALAQRNALLKKENIDKNQLFAWDVRLSELAGKIVHTRLNLINQINNKLNTIYSSISDDKTKIKLTYSCSVDTENYSAQMLKKMEKEQSLDRKRGFTGTGPHRDDITTLFNEIPAVERSSRGEVRTLLLSLKMIEMSLLEEKTGIRPTLLLDDVFSELDGARRQALTRFLQDYQTIITTTDADVVLKNFSQKCQIIPLGKN